MDRSIEPSNRFKHMDAQALAKKARNSIGKYCMEECSSLCCRKGHITLNDKELKLVIGKKVTNVKEIEVISLGKNRLCLDHDCPSLIDNKCMIHKNRNRPLICKEFPLFIDGNKIVLSHDCPAVEANKFYPFLSKFKKNGFVIS